MVYFLNFLLVFLAAIFNVSVLPHFSAFFAVPLLPLFVIISLAYFRKGFEPFILAAAVGIFLDLFSAYPFGTFLVFFLLVTAIVKNFFQEGMRSVSFWHYIGFVIGFSLFAQIFEIIYLVSYKSIFNLKYLWYFGGYLFVTVVFAILFYVFMNWYFEKVHKIENYLKRR